MTLDLWAALAALMVAAILVMVAELAAVPPEIHGGFMGASAMLVTFAVGAFARARGTEKSGDNDGVP